MPTKEGAATPAPTYRGELVPRGLALGHGLRAIATWTPGECLSWLVSNFDIHESEWIVYRPNELRERCMALYAAQQLDATPMAMLRRIPK